MKGWEAANPGKSIEEASVIKLFAHRPPINKLDGSLNNLKNCEQLSLSANSIDKMIPLAGMTKLRILSLGRNVIKKIEKLEDVGDTLEELWISYNLVSIYVYIYVLVSLSYSRLSTFPALSLLSSKNII